MQTEPGKTAQKTVWLHISCTFAAKNKNLKSCKINTLIAFGTFENLPIRIFIKIQDGKFFWLHTWLHNPPPPHIKEYILLCLEIPTRWHDATQCSTWQKTKQFHLICIDLAWFCPMFGETEDLGVGTAETRVRHGPPALLGCGWMVLLCWVYPMHHLIE